MGSGPFSDSVIVLMDETTKKEFLEVLKSLAPQDTIRITTDIEGAVREKVEKGSKSEVEHLRRLLRNREAAIENLQHALNRSTETLNTVKETLLRKDTTIKDLHDLVEDHEATRKDIVEVLERTRAELKQTKRELESLRAEWGLREIEIHNRSKASAEKIRKLTEALDYMCYDQTVNTCRVCGTPKGHEIKVHPKWCEVRKMMEKLGKNI